MTRAWRCRRCAKRHEPSDSSYAAQAALKACASGKCRKVDPAMHAMLVREDEAKLEAEKKRAAEAALKPE